MAVQGRTMAYRIMPQAAYDVLGASQYVISCLLGQPTCLLYLCTVQVPCYDV
jgi:hypothetical protein